VVCHDILGQTALVDLAGLRDAIADKAATRPRSTRWCRCS
jgi:aconitase A